MNTKFFPSDSEDSEVPEGQASSPKNRLVYIFTEWGVIDVCNATVNYAEKVQCGLTPPVPPVPSDRTVFA
jgi:hypothetical protein